MAARPIPPSAGPARTGAPDFREVLRSALEAQAREVRPGDTLPREGLLREFFRGAPPLALVHFDTPGLQDYVFRVGRPIDMRGGSAIVHSFTADNPDSVVARLGKQLDIPAKAFVYAGGGNGLLLVPAYKAERACGAIEDLLDEASAGELHAVAVALRVWPEDLREGDALPELSQAQAEALLPAAHQSRYLATRGALAALLAQRRSEQARLRATLSAEAQGQRCDACKVRPGKPRRRPSADEQHICDACEQRREVAGKERREELEARTFEDVVKGTHSRAMALLYADGSNFGRLFRRAATLQQHHDLSAAIERAFAHAAQAARARAEGLLARCEDGAPVASELRVQTPIRGGDDLVLVVPGVVALDVAETLMAEIEQQLDPAMNTALRGALEQDQAPPGVGLGVVVADHHFPMLLLLRYAKSLMASAKRRLRCPASARSAVDFMVLTSGTPLVDALERKPDDAFTRRPYTRAAFEDFLRYTRALREVERKAAAQVHAIRQEVQRGVAESRSLWRYQHARGAEDDAWARFRERLGCPSLDQVDELLWQRTPQGAFVTRYLDAVEALGCVRGEGLS